MAAGAPDEAPGGPHAATAEVDNAHIIRAYSRWAPVYDFIFGVMNWGGRRAAVQAINAVPPGRVLEAGVGTGLTLRHYNPGHRILGIDLSPEMLARARRRVAQRRLANVEGLAETDAAALPYADRSFDAVSAMYLITVVPDPEQVMGEFVRVTRPGGRIVMINHFSSESGWRAKFERWLSRYSSRIGWRPNFPIARITGFPGMRLVERRIVGPFSLFTLLVFERL